ncbi:hypothetical protein LV779_35605 [Streptomyces thinghirensis]|nr:hypothetical protein [Streptomyces thinghirensis]
MREPAHPALGEQGQSGVGDEVGAGGRRREGAVRGVLSDMEINLPASLRL